MGNEDKWWRVDTHQRPSGSNELHSRRFCGRLQFGIGSQVSDCFLRMKAPSSCLSYTHRSNRLRHSSHTITDPGSAEPCGSYLFCCPQSGFILDPAWCNPCCVLALHLSFLLVKSPFHWVIPRGFRGTFWKPGRRK